MSSNRNTEARRRWEKRWRVDREAGRLRYADERRYVDVGPVRLHVLSLMARGWTTTSLGERGGVSAQTISNIRTGKQKRLRREKALRLLAIDESTTMATASHVRAWVPKIGSVRRLHALMTLGWTHEAMTAYCGVWTSRITRGDIWVHRDTHDKIARMYRDLRTKPGPSEQTRQYAKRMGYAGPLDWDDIDLDDGPDVDWELVQQNQREGNEWRRADRNALRDEQRAPVDEAAIDHAVVWRVIDERKHPRHLTRAESAEIVRILRASDVPEAHIERLYGINPSRHPKDTKEGAA